MTACENGDALICASRASIRVTSCSFDISSENKATTAFVRDRRVLRDRQAKCGFSHRRPAGDDDEIGPLQARSHFVELAKARREPGQRVRFAALRIPSTCASTRSATGWTCEKPSCVRALGQGEYHLLGMVENYVGVIFFGKCLARDVIAGADQAADHRFVVNDLDVFLDVRKMRQTDR